MTPERIEEKKLKKGDRVVMHTCIESEEEPGKIWTCKTDQFTRGKGVFAQDSVFLEGYSGSFAPEFLQKVALHSEDERVLAALEESQQQVKDLKEDKRRIFAVHDEQYARSSEYYNELIFVKGKLAEAQLLINEYRIAIGNCYSLMSRRRKEVWELKQTVKRQGSALGDCEDYLKIQHQDLIEAQQTIARQGEIIHMIDRDLTKLRLALIAIASMDVIGSSAISMKSIAQEALREGAKES
ncbi:MULTISPECIES: hypothetical protein [Paenibacillus]|uniref:hypothetical protein n=1 Tax=Paenibacillus TaxID=44249 RepID=UPI00096FF27A|nr:hypothetical protein [Paenibacillus odorifer]OME07574.1 hypothetical protein BSK60_31005 [Paenibacillus odorifer]